MTNPNEVAEKQEIDLPELKTDDKAPSQAETANVQDAPDTAAAQSAQSVQNAQSTQNAAEAPDDAASLQPARATTAADLRAVYDVPVQVSAVLGKATLQVSQLLKLGRGAIVELDRKVGEAIDIYINDRLVARGEVVVVEDRLGVTMTEIIKSKR